MKNINIKIIVVAICLYPVLAFSENKVVVIPMGSDQKAAGMDGQVQYNDNNNIAGAGVYYDKSNGYVGIGESNPGTGLDIKSSAGYGSSFALNNTSSNGTEWRVTSWTNGTLRFVKSRGTTFTAMAMEPVNGYVGFNQTAPAQVVHVRQKLANKGIRIQHQTSSDYWESGIGTTTKNYKFYYNGSFRADISSVDGAYTQSSDGRLKHDLSYMAPVLPKVMELKPAQYKFIGGSPDAAPSTGFVAQEVEEIFPELVRDMDDGYKGVVYDGFAVISIKAIQELNQQIATMRTEIEELKKAIR